MDRRDASNEHACVCLDAPGYRTKRCECGVYSDEHGDWCANENCRALLAATSPPAEAGDDNSPSIPRETT